MNSRDKILEYTYILLHSPNYYLRLHYILKTSVESTVACLERWLVHRYASTTSHSICTVENTNSVQYCVELGINEHSGHQINEVLVVHSLVQTSVAQKLPGES